MLIIRRSDEFQSVVQRKVEYIKRTSAILRDKYDGDIPRSIEELCDLPGNDVIVCVLIYMRVCVLIYMRVCACM